MTDPNATLKLENPDPEELAWIARNYPRHIETALIKFGPISTVGKPIDQPDESAESDESDESEQAKTDGGTVRQTRNKGHSSGWNETPEWKIHRRYDGPEVGERFLPHPDSKQYGSLWLIAHQYRNGITSKELRAETPYSQKTASAFLAKAANEYNWLVKQPAGTNTRCHYKYVPTSELIDHMKGIPDRGWF